MREPRPSGQVPQIHPHQRIVRASRLAGRARQLAAHKSRISSLSQSAAASPRRQKTRRPARESRPSESPVRAAVRTRAATDARAVVDPHGARIRIAGDRARRAADHAHRVDAMHTRIGHHDVIVLRPLPNEPRIVVVRRRARPHTIVAPRAAIEIDQHRLRAVEKPMIGEKVEHLRGSASISDFGFRLASQVESRDFVDSRATAFSPQSAIRNSAVSNESPITTSAGIRNTSTYPTARNEFCHGTSPPVAVRLRKLLQPKHLAFAEIRERAMPMPMPPTHAGETPSESRTIPSADRLPPQ